jgi:hypothetical protein
VREPGNGRFQVFVSPDAFAMASMSAARVGWMVAVGRAMIHCCCRERHEALQHDVRMAMVGVPVDAVLHPMRMHGLPEAFVEDVQRRIMCSVTAAASSAPPPSSSLEPSPSAVDASAPGWLAVPRPSGAPRPIGAPSPADAQRLTAVSDCASPPRPPTMGTAAALHHNVGRCLYVLH